MIVDKLCHLSNYTGINPNLDKAIAFLQQKDFDTVVDHEDIDGDQVYYNCWMKTTRKREDASFEAHRKYIDIHICLSNQERIQVSPLEMVKASAEYDEAGDIQWLEGDEKWDVTLKVGDFMICFPEDAHIPLLDEGEEVETRKMVVKAAV